MTDRDFSDARIAVFLPCLNEASTIGALVHGFRAALPGARICVCDNLSEDGTAQAARAAGAEVFTVPRRGKGHVVATAFAEIDADVYVMADGDATYAPEDAPALVRRLLEDRLDMVIGRREGVTRDAGRAGHAFGNRLFNAIFRSIFGEGFRDIFSGYRVFSRRFAKSFPALSTGFEIETELSVHALQLRLPVAEMPVRYGRRPEGSASKLSTLNDGTRILSAFLLLMKEVKPMTFFGAVGLIALFTAFAFGIPVLNEYFRTGLVERMPTWVLTIALTILAFLMFTCGLILDSVARGRLERKRLAALAIPRFEGRRSNGTRTAAE
jgi:glycosyltransferase involved in cell wall biosynthesis